MRESLQPHHSLDVVGTAGNTAKTHHVVYVLNESTDSVAHSDEERASKGLADYAQVDSAGVWFKSSV